MPEVVFRYLMLNDNEIGEVGAEALARALPTLPKLSLLSLRCNCVRHRHVVW